MDLNIANKVKKVVKPVREELEKITETAKKQVTGSSSPRTSPIVEAMQQTGKPISPQEVEKVKGEMKKRTQILEEEIERERRKRQEREKARLEAQQKQEVVAEPGKPLPLEIPVSKPSRGRLPGMKPKSAEIIKSKM